MVCSIIESDSDNAALGRRIASALAGVVIGAGLLIHPHFGGVANPAPPAAPAPVVPGSDDHPGRRGHPLLITADADGSCYIAASINGAMFNHMLIDTGAGGYRIVLGRNHAAHAGFDPNTLSYDETYTSANGKGHSARVVIREFRVGDFVLHDVPADINDAEVFAPLVGVGIWQKLGLRVGGGRCEFRLPS